MERRKTKSAQKLVAIIQSEFNSIRFSILMGLDKVCVGFSRVSFTE